jgi:hypothetical protein
MRSFLTTWALLIAAAGIAGAQTAAQPSRPLPPAFGGHVRLSAVLFDNFFQSPDGDVQEDVPAAAVEAALHRRLGAQTLIYGDVDHTRYRDYRPSSGFTAGLRRDGRPHVWDAQAQVLRGRPSREVGDEFDRANAVAFNGQYGHRMGDWQPLALAGYRRETYELSPLKQNDAVTLGVGLRHRGLGQVSPEVGFVLGRRDVRNDNEDLREREVYLRLRWAPAPPTYVSLRVRRRFREYSIEEAGARNAGREDTRTQVVASADLWQTSRLGANVYYALEASDSTHPRGEFLSQMLAAGVVVRF